MIDLLVGACDCVKVLECTRLIAFAGQLPKRMCSMPAKNDVAAPRNGLERAGISLA